MKLRTLIFATYILSLLLMVYPFLPGKYDTSGIAFSTFVQIFCGAGLITVIPALIWFLYSIKAKRNPENQKLIGNVTTCIKIYFWITVFILSITILVIQFISRIACIILFINLIYFGIIIWRKITNRDSKIFTSVFLPVSLALLPVSLLFFQLTISKPLTDWARATVIRNSKELIEEIEKYKTTYGNYPLTLNAVNKDFETGINSIEKFHYTNDDTTYNLYFEQTRFFYDKFGTKEFVVYNPTDNHLMISHTVWHMLSDPTPARAHQGWYASHETGVKHWKIFFFD